MNNNCPCCPNHCKKNNLHCNRGIEYFQNSKEENKPQTLNENIIINLRKCGHSLHHNGIDNLNMSLSNLTEEELTTLNNLLEKISK